MQHEGTWHEPQYTGTGFPGYGVGSRLHGDSHERTVSIQQGLEVGRGFMINYNLYRHYFPLMALSRARSRFEARSETPSPNWSLQLHCVLSPKWVSSKGCLRQIHGADAIAAESSPAV